jgi:16S rRNA (uracil1498-N3)-methyltransferase
MPLRRFHATDLHNPAVTLDRDQATHATKALRLTAGQTVELFDGQGASATGTLQIEGQAATVLITDRRQSSPPSPHIEIATALPKGPRAAAMVETLSELGADAITPLATARTVVEPRDKKIDKLQRVANESAKQCGRDWILQINPLAHLAEKLADPAPDLKLIADTNQPQDQQAIHEQLASPPDGYRVLVLIGPEGGWTGDERAAAASAGFRPFNLGPHTMRIATATAAATAILRQPR